MTSVDLGLAFADAPLIADFDLKDDREAHEEHQKGGAVGALQHRQARHGWSGFARSLVIFVRSAVLVLALRSAVTGAAKPARRWASIAGG